MTEFDEPKILTPEEYQELYDEMIEKLNDPAAKHQIRVLPPFEMPPMQLAILQDNCNGYECPDHSEHVCGQILMVTTDIEGARQAKQTYELWNGEVTLEMVETKPHGWQPQEVVELETCIQAKSGKPWETDEWKFLYFHERPLKNTGQHPEVMWYSDRVVVNSVFEAKFFEGSSKIHMDVVSEVCAGIEKFLATGYEFKGGVEMGVDIKKWFDSQADTE